MTTSYDLVPTSLAIKAMRDNGYKNTAYAIAELIDNSIQAGASAIELLCCERQVFVGERTRRNVHEIAVLDNGSGMNADVLRAALQFGNGAYLSDHSGIGRFGMGLPSSSISQAMRVDVWTWNNGPGNALHSFIDLDEVEGGGRTTVPDPEPSDIPAMWQESSEGLGRSGTLVVWSRLDRCLWKTATTIIRNSEMIIGRMYRRFLNDGRVSIRLASFVEDSPGVFEIDRPAVANDPMYLMIPSSTPDPFDSTAMFQPDGDEWEIHHTIRYGDLDHVVTIRFSIARPEARNRQNAGSTKYGRHAKQNIGVSLMRADRELDLDRSLVNQYDPRERWWGVEVEFPPSLDDIFGVTNTKQSARNFTEAAVALESVLADADSIAEVRQEFIEDNDPRGPLIDIVHLIDRRLKGIRKLIKIQRVGSGRRRHQTDTAEVRATEVTRGRQEEGYRGASDDGENLPIEERAAALALELEEAGLSSDQAHSQAAMSIDQGLKYTFANADLEGRSFFTVKAVAGEILIKLNVNHPAYVHLVELLDSEPDEEVSTEELLDRLKRANRGLKLLLMAWARFEDEAITPRRREEIQDLRHEWGRYTALFLQDDQ